MKKVKDPNRLKLWQIFAWAAPGFSNAMHMMVLTFLSLYCTTMLGLNPALVSTLLLATKLIDVVTDLFVGYLVDNTNTKIGRGRPYDLCLIGTWLCTILLYSCPAEWSTVAKCIWLVSIYVLTNSGFSSLFAAASTPYMVRAFGSQEKYVKLNSYSGLITMLGAVVINIAFPMLMGSIATSHKGWTALMAITAIPGSLLALIRFLTIKEKYNVDVITEHIKVKDILHVLKNNKHIYAVALVMLIYQLVGNMGISTYYYTYVVGDVSLMGLVSVTQFLIVPVMFLFPPLLKKFKLSNVISAGFALCCVGCAINWFAKDNLLLLILGGSFTGVGVVPISMMMGLLIIDCADYNEWKGMHRMEATLSALPNLTGNIGMAFGSFLVGILLQLAGFISTTEGVIEQPASVIVMMRLLISFIPLALYVVAILIMKSYKLENQMPQIRKEIAERRAEAGVTVE